LSDTIENDQRKMSEMWWNRNIWQTRILC